MLLEPYNRSEGGIRTHGRLTPSPVFKTGSINHSDTSPWWSISYVSPQHNRHYLFELSLHLKVYQGRMPTPNSFLLQELICVRFVRQVLSSGAKDYLFIRVLVISTLVNSSHTIKHVPGFPGFLLYEVFLHYPRRFVKRKFLIGLPRFERRTKESRSRVLPLHYRPKNTIQRILPYRLILLK